MNNPYYYEGDIISVKNIKFKGSNLIDARINGHPMLILNQVDNINDEIFLLKISSSPPKEENINNYYILKPSNKNRLRKLSYVDLRYVYKIANSNIIKSYFYISYIQYEEILDKLEEVQKYRKDREYYLFKNYYLKLKK